MRKRMAHTGCTGEAVGTSAPRTAGLGTAAGTSPTSGATTSVFVQHSVPSGQSNERNYKRRPADAAVCRMVTSEQRDRRDFDVVVYSECVSDAFFPPDLQRSHSVTAPCGIIPYSEFSLQPYSLSWVSDQPSFEQLR